jgi:hypothetical protein
LAGCGSSSDVDGRKNFGGVGSGPHMRDGC